MRFDSRFGRLAGLLLMLLTLLAFPAAPMAAQGTTGTSSVEIHDRLCPTDYTGDTYFADCHGTSAGADVPFTIANGVTKDGTTDADGNVSFADLPAGTYTITGGAPGEFTNRFVYCSIGEDTATSREEIPVTDVTTGVRLELPADTAVICDWYTIPVSQGQATPTVPAATSSLEIHDRICPAGYEGDSFFADCHGNAAQAGVAFTLSDGVTQEQVTNDEGSVAFADLPAGTYTVTSSATSEFADLFVYCAVGTEAQPDQERIPVTNVTGGVQFDLPADTSVICDWYNIPAAEPTVVPTMTPTEVPPTVTPTAVPPTITPTLIPPTVTPTVVPTEAVPTATIPLTPGRTLQIRTGTCAPDEIDTAVVVDLPDLRAPEQEAIANANVAIAETSSSVVAMTFDALESGNYVVVAYERDNPSVPVACTEIAGPVNQNGELVLGLREMNQSDYAGIVYLAPSRSDTSETGISVFLAKGLVPERVPGTPAG